jgi:hypothetical protein
MMMMGRLVCLASYGQGEATDIHGVRRIEQATRNADGAYVVRFPYDASLYDAYRIPLLSKLA